LVSLEQLGENHEEMSADIRARLNKFPPQCENTEEKANKLKTQLINQQTSNFDCCTVHFA
jgi:hypothetical protein